MAQGKVTKEDLLSIRVGQTRIFTLTEKGKLQSVATYCTNLKNEGVGEWSVRKDYETCAVSVTRVK